MSYKFTEDYLKKSLNYEGYIALTEKLLSEGRTTGENQEQMMIDYTKLNFQRMKRIYITTEVKPDLVKLLKTNQHWVVITEPWCGDAANTVPLLAKIASLSGNINFHVLLRDENPEVMNEYLTNGAKSIPILIVLDNNYNELVTWGPRPQELQKMVLDYKKEPGFDIEILKEKVQKWYLDDKTVTTQKELIKSLSSV